MTQLILDLDTGIDDAMALAFACAWDQIELLGVTATYGNIDVERAAQNTLNLLDLFGENHILSSGAPARVQTPAGQPLTQPLRTSTAATA